MNVYYSARFAPSTRVCASGARAAAAEEKEIKGN